ncbi:pre-mRNA cleavage and polyadenylation factor (CPF) complex subunit [Blastocladiella emersonii ATCC 22665]|nr:pre-mRNA cleavage and polyadenylation factor (CPF) complex subunit [Blastocladiella emersonii ATCC 22665]
MDHSHRDGGGGYRRDYNNNEHRGPPGRYRDMRDRDHRGPPPSFRGDGDRPSAYGGGGRDYGGDRDRDRPSNRNNGGGGDDGDEARNNQRRSFLRRTVDYNGGVVLYQQHREIARAPSRLSSCPVIQPDLEYLVNMLPPMATPDKPVNACTTRFIHTSMNKFRTYVNVVRWTPEGRRLITGSASGEFTLWNGLTFNFETILQAHETSVRSMRWSRSGSWLLSGDNAGYVKYWQSNMNNLKSIQVHKEAVRGISFSPSDAKFATCSDDKTVKVWSFHQGTCETTMTGHGWDVKCLDWHPYKAMIASGSKDNLIKLWDPRAGKQITTLHGHKNTIHAVSWNRNGNWLLSGSRDQNIKIFDIRSMREMANFKGHPKEVCSVAWHPHHETLFASGGSEGSLLWWLADRTEGPISQVLTAHDANIWALDWHPLGHVLCTGSNDYATRFWTRARPGESEFSEVVPTADGIPGTNGPTVDADGAVGTGGLGAGGTDAAAEDAGFYLPGFGTIGLNRDSDTSSAPAAAADASTGSGDRDAGALWRAAAHPAAALAAGASANAGAAGAAPEGPMSERELEREIQRRRRKEMFDDFFGPRRRGTGPRTSAIPPGAVGLPPTVGIPLGVANAQCYKEVREKAEPALLREIAEAAVAKSRKKPRARNGVHVESHLLDPASASPATELGAAHRSAAGATAQRERAVTSKVNRQSRMQLAETERARHALAVEHEQRQVPAAVAALRASVRREALETANTRSVTRARTHVPKPTLAAVEVPRSRPRSAAGTEKRTPVVDYQSTRFHSTLLRTGIPHAVERPAADAAPAAATEAVASEAELVAAAAERARRTAELADRAQTRGIEALRKTRAARDQEEVHRALATARARDWDRRKVAFADYIVDRAATRVQVPPESQLERAFVEAFPEVEKLVDPEKAARTRLPVKKGVKKVATEVDKPASAAASRPVARRAATTPVLAATARRPAAAAATTAQAPVPEPRTESSTVPQHKQPPTTRTKSAPAVVADKATASISRPSPPAQPVPVPPVPHRQKSAPSVVPSRPSPARSALLPDPLAVAPPSPPLGAAEHSSSTEDSNATSQLLPMLSTGSESMFTGISAPTSATRTTVTAPWSTWHTATLDEMVDELGSFLSFDSSALQSRTSVTS